jgi:invasion protein IalB
MMTISSRVAATTFGSLLLFASPVLAQTATAPAAKSDAAAPAATDKKPHTAASLECSKEFRSDCKKEAADKAK